MDVQVFNQDERKAHEPFYCATCSQGFKARYPAKLHRQRTGHNVKGLVK